MNAIVDVLILTVSLAFAFVGYRLLTDSPEEKRRTQRERLYTRMISQ